MNHQHRIHVLAVLSLMLVAPLLVAMNNCGPSPTIHDRNASLGRSINLGAALEAPVEGEWGVTLESGFFDVIADAGFDSVRVPIRWSSRAANSPPYTIDPAFFERVDWVLDQAARVGLTTVINMHHYEELLEDPAGHRDRFLGMWQQIALRYAGRPLSVYFEVLNEPEGVFATQPQLWNSYFADALSIIRQYNPTRPVVVGPASWNVIDLLEELVLPQDANLIATVHYYEPSEFTHQGAFWVDPPYPTGVPWNPDVVQFGPAFQDWSWDTQTTGQVGSLRAQFGRQHAAVNLHPTTPVEPFSIDVEVMGTASLGVLCGNTDGSFDFIGQIDHDGASWGSYTMDVTSCGPNTTDVALQNLLQNAPDVFLRNGQLCGASGCDPLFTSSSDAIALRLGQAAAWGAANNRPIFVGEFGTYILADMTSRALWTAEVQQAAQTLGMSTAYWDFASGPPDFTTGFGAYNIIQQTWVAPILNALIP